MTRLYEYSKTIALKWLPRGILNHLKKSHYLNKVREVSLIDEPDLEIVGQLVGLGDCVVDLGANIGVYTVFMSRLVSDAGRVYSFEPMPATHGFLKHSVSRLGLRNVIVRQAAVTDQACRITMRVPKDERGAENFYQASVVEDSGRVAEDGVVAVDGVPLDQAVSADIDRIKFIKCDVEGHELHCLQGATEVISRSRPAWLMEVGGNPERPGGNASAVFTLMRDRGYGIWVFRRGRVEPWQPGLRSINYLFLYPEHVDRLRDKKVLDADSSNRDAG